MGLSNESVAVTQIEALVHEGLEASQTGDGARAIALFEQACAAAPSHALPHFLLGSEFAALGDVDKAESAFANAVVLAPDWNIARYQLGLLQYSSGRAATALVTWTALFELDEGNALTHFVQGFAALAGDSFDEAAQHFRAGLACPIDNPALAGDVEKVLARISVVHPQADSSGEARTEPQAASHVLLSNYGRFGSLH